MAELRPKIVAVVALAVGLAGCQVSVATGLIGGLLTIALAWVAVSLASRGGGATAQPMVGPCLSPLPPPFDGGAPPSEAPPSVAPPSVAPPSVGPCLSMPAPWLGPCLSVLPPPAPDAGVPTQEPRIGPCLSIAPPRKRPRAPATEAPLQICLSDIDVGPCLKMAPDPEGGGAHALPPAGFDEAAVLARVINRLPPDVAARLRKSDT